MGGGLRARCRCVGELWGRDVILGKRNIVYTTGDGALDAGRRVFGEGGKKTDGVVNQESKL